MAEFRQIPLSLKDANKQIALLHRHAGPVRNHRFSLGLIHEPRNKLIGAAIVANPVGPTAISKAGLECELKRLVTDGTKNACSFLIAAATRTAFAMGFMQIRTYTLPSESGTSLIAAGWTEYGLTAGNSWNHPGRPRSNAPAATPRKRWIKTNVIGVEKLLAAEHKRAQSIFPSRSF